MSNIDASCFQKIFKLLFLFGRKRLKMISFLITVDILCFTNWVSAWFLLILIVE